MSFVMVQNNPRNRNPSLPLGAAVPSSAAPQYRNLESISTHTTPNTHDEERLSASSETNSKLIINLSYSNDEHGRHHRTSRNVGLVLPFVPSS